MLIFSSASIAYATQYYDDQELIPRIRSIQSKYRRKPVMLESARDRILAVLRPLAAADAAYTATPNCLKVTTGRPTTPKIATQ